MAHLTWVEEAACKSDPNFFDAETVRELEHCRRRCAQCPVARACYQYAIDHRIEYGMWGGLTPKERARISGIGWVRGQAAR